MADVRLLAVKNPKHGVEVSIKQLNEDDFLSLYLGEKRHVPLTDCCVLPYRFKELVGRLGVSFTTEYHDGSDISLAYIDYKNEDCFVLFSRQDNIDGNPEVWLKSPSSIGVDKMNDIVNYMSDFLGITRKDYVWINSGELE